MIPRRRVGVLIPMASSRIPRFPVGGDRRSFLATGVGALLVLPRLAGCDAGEKKGSQAEPSAGKDSSKIDPEAHDVELLNAGIALEQGAINVYTAAAGLPFISSDATVLAVATLFMGQHEEHRDTLAKLVQQFGGTPIDPKTAKTPEIPAAILDESATPEARKLAVLQFARKLEREAADTYFQLIVQQFLTDVARRSATEILPVEAQHVAVYDLVLGAAKPVNAALFSEQT